MKAPAPIHEAERLQALHRYQVLDTEPETIFDDLTRLASQICGTPLAWISLLDERRQWFKSKVGIKLKETPREAALCAYGILEPDVWVIPDTRKDERFVSNPLVRSGPKIRFYAGAQLFAPSRHAIGMLCVADRKPRRLNPAQMAALRVLSHQVMTQLELRRSLTELQQAVAERELTEESLHQRTDYLQLQQVVAAKANETGSVEEAMQVGLDLVCAYTGWALGHVFWKSDEAAAVMVSTDIWHGHEPSRYASFVQATMPMRIGSGDGLLGRVLRDRKPACIPAIADDPNCVRAKVAAEAGIQSGVAFPVVAGQEVVAILEFFSEQMQCPTERLLQMLVYVGTQLGRVVERHQAETALRRSEEHFRALTESASDLVAVLSPDGTLRYLSPSVERMLGYAQQELVGQNAFQYVHPDDVAHMRKVFQEVARKLGSIEVREFRFRCKDGSFRQFKGIGRNLMDDPSVAGIVVNSRDITERKKAEDALRNSEERYRGLFETMREGFALCEIIRDGGGKPVDYRFLEANSAFESILGLKRAEAIGRTVRTIFPKVEPCWIDTYGKVAITGEPVHFTEYLEALDKYFEVDAHCPKPGQFAAIFTDVSERKKAEKALKERAEADKLVSSISTRFVTTMSNDMDCAIQEALQSVGAFVGADRSYLFLISAEGTTIDNTHEWCATGITPQIDNMKNISLDAFGWLKEKLMRSEVVHVPRVADLPPEADATRVMLEAQQVQSLLLVPMFYGQTPVGLIGFDAVVREKAWTNEDITLLKLLGEIFVNAFQRKKSETALQESNLRLEEALAQLQRTQQQIIQQERLRALGQMASGIAHDFNNALAPVVGFSELLLHHPETRADSKKCSHYLEVMNTAANDAAKIVGRLREFYRQREETDVLSPVQLEPLVSQAISLTRPKWRDQALARGIDIRVDTDLRNTTQIEGDETALREMLTNLIFNAVDAMPAGGVLRIATCSDDGHVVLKVGDTGTGMTEEVRRRCLEPFFTTKGKMGTGLGLSMVHGIVRRHDGNIDIQSEWGRGTTFVIRLPVRGTSPVEARVSAPQTPHRPLRILLIDDEPMVREIEAEYLKTEGHTVSVAENGPDGLNLFRTNEFDLVIMDRAMPVMSGDQLAAVMKQISPRIPIILLTGFGDMMKAIGETPSHIDLILSKPIGLEKLRDAVAKLASDHCSFDGAAARNLAA